MAFDSLTSAARDSVAPTGQTQSRAAESLGTSADAVYRMVARALGESGSPPGRLYDVGCGAGRLRKSVEPYCESYAGLDAVRYADFPADAEFLSVDLDAPVWPVPDDSADVAVSAETIEHLENPRAFFRELARITRPGGLVIVTTPNQSTWLNFLALAVKGQHVHFQEKPGQYPTHLTALLPIDLLRIAREVGLTDVRLAHTGVGRMPGTARHWPRLPGMRGLRFSDNVAVIGRKAGR